MREASSSEMRELATDIEIELERLRRLEGGTTRGKLPGRMAFV